MKEESRLVGGAEVSLVQQPMGVQVAGAGVGRHKPAGQEEEMESSN